MYRRCHSLAEQLRGAPRQLSPARSWGCTDPPRPVSAVARMSRQWALVEPPSGPHARATPLSRVEAVLFLTSEPLSSRKLAQFANLADGTEARTMVRRLNQLYDASGSAFRVEEVGGGFQLLSRPWFAGWLRRLHQSPVEVRLSGPAMETLAVVAYRQPVLRVEVEAIRGVQCGEMLRQLMERDLVKIGGRADELGRPFLYCTTRHFLRVFGLRHLDELPRAESLRAHSADTQSQASSVDQQDQSSNRGLGLNDEESDVNVPVSDVVSGPFADHLVVPDERDPDTGPSLSHADFRAELESEVFDEDDFEDEDDEYEIEDDDDDYEDDDVFDDDEEEEDDADLDDDLEDDEWEEVGDEDDDDEVGDDDDDEEEEWDDDDEDDEDWEDDDEEEDD